MGTEADVREFIARVLPWPVEDRGIYTGYANLHWFLPPKTKGRKPPFVGKPFQTLDRFVSFAKWIVQQANTRDLYFCTSLQSETVTNKKNKIDAVRLAENALGWKAIWLDLDCLPPGGKNKDEYHDQLELLDHLQKFIAHFKLPPPSALIGSGQWRTPEGKPAGGVQAYWISKTPLTLEQWEPYAQGLAAAAKQFGLKCDTQCTVDRCRVLRMPGSFNYKVEPRRPTTVIALGQDVDLPLQLQMLLELTPVTATVTETTAAPFDLSMFPKRAIPPEGIESLAEGLGFEEKPLDPYPIMKGCAFLRKALVTGGKDYPQPLWNLTTLCGSFMDNAETIIHNMANKHAGYSYDETQELYERKMRERKKKGLGWPHCKKIQEAGCTDCASCPFFAAGKSPLHLAGPAQQANNPPPPVGVGSGRVSVLTDDDFHLPEGFFLDQEGFVSTHMQGKKNEPDYDARLFHKKILPSPPPWMSTGPDCLNFTIDFNKGKIKEISIPMAATSSDMELKNVLHEQGCLIITNMEFIVRSFTVSWINKLHEAQRAVQSQPFGWWKNEKDGESAEVHGFVYGGKRFTDDGKVHPAGYCDTEIRRTYHPAGSIKPWLEACKMVTDRKRPEFDAIIASAFASPLMRVSGEYCALLSLRGEKGSGKSTAVKVASAVWGHPKKSKDGSVSTHLSVLNKMGKLVNLPIYYDEIALDAQERVFKALMVATEGVEGSRLTSTIKYQNRGDWQNIMVLCSNDSFIDHVVAKQKTTPAGIYRVFEYEANKAGPGAPGALPTMEASRITQQLEDNYGCMGLAYAELLGSDPAGVDAFTKKIIEDVVKDVNQNDYTEERFWPATVGTLVAGAILANQLGATIDVPAMRQFLIAQYFENRKRAVREDTNANSEMNVLNILTGFIKDHNDQQLWTDTFHTGPGNPKGVVSVYAARADLNKPINIQWVVWDRVLRLSREAMRKYCVTNVIPLQALVGGLTNRYGAVQVDGTLGAGTVHKTGVRETIYQLYIPEGSPFEENLYLHSQLKDIEDSKAHAREIAARAPPPVPKPRFDTVAPPLGEYTQRAREQTAQNQAAKDLETVRKMT